MRVPSETLNGIQRGINGAELGPEDARPFIPPSFSPVLQIPQPVVVYNPAAKRTIRSSAYFNWNEVIPASFGGGSIEIVTLAPGLWRINGLFERSPQPLVGGPLVDGLNLNFRNFNLEFLRANRRLTSVTPFDFRILLDSETRIDRYSDATGVGETVEMNVSLHLEKLL